MREPSTTFLEHSLALADTHLLLRRAEQAGQLELVAVETEPRCWRHYTGLHSARETLRPDLYVVTASGDYEDCFFIEVDLGSESLPRLLAKCSQYQAYRRTGIEQRQREVFPFVVWVMPGVERVAKLRSALDGSRTADSELFRVVTANELVSLLRAGGAA